MAGENEPPAEAHYSHQPKSVITRFLTVATFRVIDECRLQSRRTLGRGMRFCFVGDTWSSSWIRENRRK